MKKENWYFKNKLTLNSLLSASLLFGGASASAQSAKEYAKHFTGVIGKTSADSKEAWPQNPQAPKGAPNVVWILIDDVGFGASSTFGGVIATPTLDSLANQGLRYTNFHTCAICAPTRASLLTGRNSSAVHMAGFAHIGMGAGYPGWDGHVPPEAGTIAEVLHENGYNTFAVGKYGITPDADATDAGPFERWPSGKGFDHFFGFLGSQTDQYKPDLVEDNAHVKTDGRHLSEQITDKAISFIDRQKKAAPDKPFFLYYAPGATHAPHQVATEWSDKYKGKFDDGWDAFREKVIANQKKLGIIPANATLPARNENVKPWGALSDVEKKVYARFMEVYAGYLTYTDYEISRVVNHLKQINQLDNTLIFVVIGDNGASKEGKDGGTIESDNRAAIFKKEDGASLLKQYDRIGTPNSSPNYPIGWAQAANTPFKYWKQDANSEGGTRNPLIVFYPKGIKDKGTIRTQYGHVIDLFPTTTELLGIKQPKVIHGIKQDSIQGISLAYSINNAQAPSKHKTQYYYIFGSRSIYKDGWKAATLHGTTKVDWIKLPDLSTASDPARFDKDVWELYNMNEDFNEINDLAKKYPEKLKELKALFDDQAKKNNLYPLLDWEDVLGKFIKFGSASKAIN